VVSDWEYGPDDEDGHPVDRVSLRAVIGTTGGGLLRASVTGDLDDAEKLGAALAAELLDMGGLPAPGEQQDRET
jgi:hydroxymethylbilane synthase